MGTLIIDKTAEQLLDFSKPQIDINILDSVVNTMHAGSGPQVSLGFKTCCDFFHMGILSRSLASYLM